MNAKKASGCPKCGFNYAWNGTDCDHCKYHQPPSPAQRDDLQKLQEDFLAETKAQGEKIKRPTVLVCGYTGSGKTSLISAICGQVPEEAVKHGAPSTKEYKLYENAFVRFWDSKGLEPGQKESEFIENTRKFVRVRQDDPDVDNHIHLVWYCIQGCGARVTQSDKKLIREIFANVIVLVTKNDITDEDQRREMQKELEAEGIAQNRILFCSKKDQESLKTVVHLTKELLPQAFQGAWVAAQLVDLDLKKLKAQGIIQTAAALASAAGGLNPIPISDALLITPIQTGMIVSLAVSEAWEIGRQVAVALQCAHAQHVLHRDVKPANILVRMDEFEGGILHWETRLIDFGPAVRTSDAQSTARALSAGRRTVVAESIAGTLDYAAPEQIGRLANVAISSRSDIYGFGKTLCYALFQTPQPTFQHWRKVPEQLAELLGRCLAEKPQDRPADFSEVVTGLETINVSQHQERPITASEVPPKPTDYGIFQRQEPVVSPRVPPKPTDYGIFQNQEPVVSPKVLPATQLPGLLQSISSEGGNLFRGCFYVAFLIAVVLVIMEWLRLSK